MEDLSNVKAIVLSRQDFRENDVLVYFFSREKGVFSLVARGAKKKTSKLVGHIEPLNLVDLMIIKGRHYDLIGSVRNIDVFFVIKKNYEKLDISFRILKDFKRLIREGEIENEIFQLLNDSLESLNQNINIDLDIFYNIFLLKLFKLIGFSIETNTCISCSRKIIPNNNYININLGGLVCSSCVNLKNNLTISNDCIKMLKLAKTIDIKDVSKVNIGLKLKKDFSTIVSSFKNYYSY